MHVLEFLINNVFVNQTKKQKVFYIFRIFEENLSFLKVPYFTVIWLVRLFLYSDIGVYCQCDYIHLESFHLAKPSTLLLRTWKIHPHDLVISAGGQETI